MVKHAQHRNNASKKRIGVAVGNRFKVDVYFESREAIATIDKARRLTKKSRSAFLAEAGIGAATLVIHNMGNGREAQ